MENSLKYSTLLYERKTRIPVGEIKKCFRNIQVYTISVKAFLVYKFVMSKAKFSNNFHQQCSKLIKIGKLNNLKVCRNWKTKGPGQDSQNQDG